MRSSFKFLIAVLIISISINAFIGYYYSDKYTPTQLFDKFIGSQTTNFEPIQIPEIYENQVLLLSFEKNVSSKHDFIPWKAELIKKFQNIFEIPNYDDIILMPVEKISGDEQNEYLLNKYSTSAQDNDKIIFYELKPKNDTKLTFCEGKPCYSTVLIIPGSGNQGALDVINQPSQYSPYYYHQGIAEKLVKLGYVVFVIENRGWGERVLDIKMNCEQPDVYCSGNKLHKHLLNLGYNQHSLQIIDTMQLLKHIHNLDYVNNEKITIAGLSLGGPVSIAVSNISPNVASTVAASGIISQYKTGGSGITPGMLEYFDQPDLAAALSPKPLYLSWGLNENVEFGYEANNQYSAKLISNSYKLFDSEEKLTIIIHDEQINHGHTFEITSLIDFINNTIG